MLQNYCELRKSQNIRPLQLPHREQFYLDTLNIERSYSGRMDGIRISNTFLSESVQMLINSIEQFELGYFDAAYYSLRSAVELSTTMVYLLDIDDGERKASFEEWKNLQRFPVNKKIIEEIKKSGAIFKELSSKMSFFFEDARDLSQKLNKYVHKQGFQNFYVSRNHLSMKEEPQDSFISEYENNLKQCISVVAVMRLAIDPFPLLLMDDEIRLRFDSLTEPYSEYFVEKYLTAKIIKAYKDTSIYKGTDEWIKSTFEKKTIAAHDVRDMQYVDSTKIEEILTQRKLLPEFDVISVLIIKGSKNIVRVYVNGFLVYWTDREKELEKLGWQDVTLFQSLRGAKNKFNYLSSGNLFSMFEFGEHYYIAEHKEILTECEIKDIQESVEMYLKELAETKMEE